MLVRKGCQAELHRVGPLLWVLFKNRLRAGMVLTKNRRNGCCRRNTTETDPNCHAKNRNFVLKHNSWAGGRVLCESGKFSRDSLGYTPQAGYRTS